MKRVPRGLSRSRCSILACFTVWVCGLCSCCAYSLFHGVRFYDVLLDTFACGSMQVFTLFLYLLFVNKSLPFTSGSF